MFQDRYPYPQALEHLPKFHGNDPTADDHQVVLLAGIERRDRALRPAVLAAQVVADLETCVAGAGKVTLQLPGDQAQAAGAQQGRRMCSGNHRPSRAILIWRVAQVHRVRPEGSEPDRPDPHGNPRISCG